MNEYHVIGLMTDDGDAGEFLNVYTRCPGKFRLDRKSLKINNHPTSEHQYLFNAYQNKGCYPQGFHFYTDGKTAKFDTMIGEFTANVVEIEIDISG